MINGNHSHNWWLAYCSQVAKLPPPPKPKISLTGIPGSNKTAAVEELVDLAIVMKSRRLVMCEGLKESDIAEIKLAVDFYARGPLVVLKALVENWSRDRVVRETYLCHSYLE